MCERCDKLREGATSYQDIADAARQSATEDAQRLRDPETPIMAVALDLMQRHDSAREGAMQLLAGAATESLDKVDLEMCATILSVILHHEVTIDQANLILAGISMARLSANPTKAGDWEKFTASGALGGELAERTR